MAQKLPKDDMEIAHSTKLSPSNSPSQNPQPSAVVTTESVGNGTEEQNPLESNSSSSKSAFLPATQEPETPKVKTSAVTTVMDTAIDGQAANETGPSSVCDTTASSTSYSQVLLDVQPSVLAAVSGTVAQPSTSAVHGLSAVPIANTKILVSQPNSASSVQVCANGLNVLLNKQAQNTSQLAFSKIHQVPCQSATQISRAIPGLTKLPLTSPAGITGSITAPLQIAEKSVRKLPSDNKSGTLITCTVTGISPQSTVSPPPVVVPEFLPGKVNAQLFPPRHYNFKCLEIGSWKYTSKASDFLCTSRVKTVFSQRKLVYEFQLTTDSLQDAILGMRRMASIEVPFHTIRGINISAKNDVLLEVNHPPAMYLGSQELHSGITGHNEKVKYDTKTTVDITDEQLSFIPYHKISSVRGLKNRLREFDPRFAALLHIPVVVDPNKRLSSIRPTPIAKPRKQKSSGVGSVGPSSKKKRPGPTASASSSGSAKEGLNCCSCTTGCKSKRCACSKIPAKCSQYCKCVECSNPLNILEEIGVNVNAAKRDHCFMQNAAKTENLRDLLQGSVSTPCCEEEIPLKDCVVGVVECPEEDCGAEYRYSWCGNDLCDDENRPRYHCPICKCCGDYRDQHCKRCNKCYFAGSMGSFKCPCRERRAGGAFGFGGLAALWNMF